MIPMKMRLWTIFSCALMISLLSGCRSNRPSDMRYPDYSSRYTRQAREYEEMREKARREEEARLKREEEARLEQEKKAEKERKKLEKRLAEEREAREKEARKLAERQARAEEAARRAAQQQAARAAAAQSSVRIPPPAAQPPLSVSQAPAVPAASAPLPTPQSDYAVPSPTPVSVPPSQFRSAGGTSPYVLKPGDFIAIYLRGIPREEEIQDVVDEQGYVTLTYINEVKAAGKTTSELERAIREAYLTAEIYKNISVNVVMMQQSYFVRGEVKSPGRFALMSGVTLLQAIAAAGGYTEFAQPKKVKLIRGDDSRIIDVRDIEKNPEKDIPIEAEDVIVVPRSVF